MSQKLLSYGVNQDGFIFLYNFIYNLYLFYFFLIFSYGKVQMYANAKTNTIYP